jgi:hypothetical protein
MGDLLLFTEEGGQVDLRAWKEVEHHINLSHVQYDFFLGPFHCKSYILKEKNLLLIL